MMRCGPGILMNCFQARAPQLTHKYPSEPIDLKRERVSAGIAGSGYYWVGCMRSGVKM